MTKVIHGKVHGRTIELAKDLGLAEGQEVKVCVRPVPAGPPLPVSVLANFEFAVCNCGLRR